MIGGVDIRFTFLENHKATMKMDIMGEHEVENLKWYINEEGGLVIDDDDPKDGDDAWFLDGDRLVQYDKRGKVEKDVYLVRAE